MSGIGGASGAGGAMSIDRIMAMRAEILERNSALKRASAGAATPAEVLGTPATSAPKPVSFADTMASAVKGVTEAQAQSSDMSARYERGEEIDIAKVMMARQQASVGFEATLQVRNKLLTAYKDIMSMPV